MTHKKRILGMLQMGPVCGTRFLSEYMPRYAARIHDLRSDGHTITTEPCRFHDHSTPQVVYRLETESQMSLI